MNVPQLMCVCVSVCACVRVPIYMVLELLAGAFCSLSLVHCACVCVCVMLWGNSSKCVGCQSLYFMLCGCFRFFMLCGFCERARCPALACVYVQIRFLAAAAAGVAPTY